MSEHKDSSANASTHYCDGDGLNFGIINQPNQFKIFGQAKDVSKVEVRFQGEPEQITAVVTYEHNGTHKVEYTPTKHGNYQLFITCNGVQIKNSPFKVTVATKDEQRIRQLSLENHRQRVVRVFLSSTFRDMHNEREVIMRRVMVALNDFCYERSVSLSYIDMRWGITDEMGKNGKTIISCLREADHSRPYFVGILGERYGWHQEKDGADSLLTKSFEEAELFPEYEWVKQFRTRSVTELEILHGFLRYPATSEPHYFFYLRNPHYIDTLSSDPAIKRDYEDKADYAKERMVDLKDRIRKASQGGLCKLVDGYNNPDHLGELLLEHLKEIIERDFPLSKNKDISDLEKMRSEHENYAHKRSVVYVGQRELLTEIDNVVGNVEGQGLVVVGNSGSGRSSLIANWWKSWNARIAGGDSTRKRPILHFVGASSSASQLTSILLRLILEINEICGTKKDEVLPRDEGKLAALLPGLLASASAAGGLVIILGALDQLSEARHKSLWWFPQHLPKGVHVIVSTSPGPILDAAVKRGWKRIEVDLLDESERRQLVQGRLLQYGKTITTENTEQIVSHPLSANPLFLTTVMLEMCIVGYYDKFQSQLKEFLSCKDLPSLFQKVLERWEIDFGRDFVENIFTLLVVSRRGLTEDELRDMSGRSPMEVAWVMAASRQMLVDNRGFLNFGHEYLRQAVIDRYLQGSSECNARLRITKALSKLNSYAERAIEELPYQWSQLLQMKNFEQSVLDRSGVCFLLHSYLLDLDNVVQFRKTEEHKLDFMKYWRIVIQHAPEVSIGDEYLQQAERVVKEVGATIVTATVLDAVGRFLEELAFFSQAQEIEKLCLAVREKLYGENHTEVAISLTGLANMAMKKMVDVKSIRALYERALSIQEKTYGENHLHVAMSLHNLALLASREGNYSAARPLCERALSIQEKLHGENHHAVATALAAYADLLSDMNEYDKAKTLYERALSIRKKQFGDHHPEVASTLHNLAVLASDNGNYKLATQLLEQALSIQLEVFGEKHPLTANTLNTMGTLAVKKGEHSDAKLYYKRVLAIHEQCHGENSVEVGGCLNNMADLACDMGEFSIAKPLYVRALEIMEKVLGENHRTVGSILNNMGTLALDVGEDAAAKPLFERALKIQEKTLGETHSIVAQTISNLAIAVKNIGDRETAKSLNTRALNIREKLFGEVHPDVAVSLNNLAILYSETGDYVTAKSLCTRALAIREKVFGENHFRVALCLNNLANFSKSTGDYAAAKPLYERALTIRQDALGKNHPDVAQTLSDMANLLSVTGDSVGAKPLYERALTIREGVYGPNHTKVVETRNNLAALKL